MAASYNATATVAAAFSSIMAQKVTAISTVEFTNDDYLDFFKTILAAAMKVPTTLGGGEHGHAYLVLDETDLRKFTEKPTLTEAGAEKPSAEAPEIAQGDSHATIALKHAQKAIEMNKYYTQQGVLTGLRDLIVQNVPKAVIEELKDRHFGFEAVTPLQLLQHIEGEAEPVDIIGQNDLLEEVETPIDFEGDKSMKEFFKQIDRTIKLLKDDHQIETSHTALMAKYLLQIEKEGGLIFDKHLTAWRAKDQADKTWKNFKEAWIKADKERRKNNKLSAGRGIVKQQANNMEDLKQTMETMFAAGMTTFAEAAEESINQVVASKLGNLKSGNSDDGGNKNDKLVEQLKKEIKALKSKLNEGGGGGSSSNGGGGGGGNKRKGQECAHCGKIHKGYETEGGEKKCWRRKEFRHNAPEWWKTQNPLPPGKNEGADTDE